MTKGIKILILIMSLMALPHAAFAQATSSTANSIFINQVGDANDITLTQQGQGNAIGSEAARFSIQGSNQVITSMQDGNNNTIDGKIEQADNINYNFTSTGDSNKWVFLVGDAASVAGSNSTVAVTGDSNQLTFNQGTTSSATGATQNITISGDLNKYTSTINADDVTNTVTATGSHNEITVTQLGEAGKNVNMQLQGDTNKITIDQKSTLNVDSLHLNTTGSNNTISVHQCDSGVC